MEHQDGVLSMGTDGAAAGETELYTQGAFPWSADLAEVWCSGVRAWLPHAGSSEKRERVCSLPLGRSGGTHPEAAGSL